jgi:Flp pilus assembly protein CpaB
MAKTHSTPSQTTPTWHSSARRRAPFYVLAAILLAAIAGLLTYNYLQAVRATAVPTGAALVASQDIRPGTRLSEDMLEVRHVPEAVLPSGYLTSISQSAGRVALVPIAAGEVILDGKVSGGPGEGLSSRLPDGRWAMTLPAGWLVSPMPEIAVGDRIELLAYQAGSPIEDAAVIVSGIEILQVPGAGESPDRLTLAVTMEEAKAVLYARSNGFALMPLLRPQGG